MTGQSAKVTEKDSGPNSRQSDAHAEQSLAAANKETWSALLWPKVLICKGNNIQNTATVHIQYQIMKGCLINDKRDARISGPDCWCSESKEGIKRWPRHRLHGREKHQGSACLRKALCHRRSHGKSLRFTAHSAGNLHAHTHRHTLRYGE